MTVVAHEAPREVLPTTPGERLDLDLEEMSSDTSDDVSIANLFFYTHTHTHIYIYIYIHTCFFVLLTNSSILLQFSIGINPHNLPAISIDVDSLGGSDAQITPACRPCCCNPGTSSAVTMCLKLYFFFCSLDFFHKIMLPYQV